MPSNNGGIAVSVCVLTYNQEETVGRTIDSILNQKFDLPFEIIIGEDGSSDKTLEVCRKYQEKYPDKIRVVSTGQNRGLLANVKSVTELVRGKFFGFCAGDDFWHDENKVRLQYEFLNSRPDYAVVFSSYMIEDLSAGTWLPFKASNIKEGYVFNYLMMGNFIGAVTAMVRTEYYHQYVDIGSYINKGFMMEDFPAWLDLSYRYKFGFIDKPLATYQISGSSISCPVKVEKNLLFAKNVISVKKYYSNLFNVDKKIIRKSLYISNIQILGLVRRYNKISDYIKIALSTDYCSIAKYLLRL